MTGKTINGNSFIERLTEVITANLTNDQFGVAELAREMGMNRSYIHRQLKKLIKVEGMDGHPFYSAWWNAILGNKDEAIYWLEQTLEYPRPLGHYSNLITTNPDFDLLRDDPRFLEIVDKFGLTPWHKIKVE